MRWERCYDHNGNLVSLDLVSEDPQVAKYKSGDIVRIRKTGELAEFIKQCFEQGLEGGWVPFVRLLGTETYVEDLTFGEIELVSPLKALGEQSG